MSAAATGAWLVTLEVVLDAGHMSHFVTPSVGGSHSHAFPSLLESLERLDIQVEVVLGGSILQGRKRAGMGRGPIRGWGGDQQGGDGEGTNQRVGRGPIVPRASGTPHKEDRIRSRGR